MSLDLQRLNPSTKYLLKGFEGASLAKNLVAFFKKQAQPLLVLTNDTKSAFKLKDQIQFFSPHISVHILLPYEILPYHGLSPQPKVVTNQLKILSLSLSGKIDILISPTENLLRQHLPLDLFLEGSAVISKNQTHSLKYLVKTLVNLGYTRETLVEERGQFAVRGDILDVFLPEASQGIRLNFFGDEIESLRTFDPATQRTTGEVLQIQILPAKEILLDTLLKASDPENPEPEYEAYFQTGWRSLLKKRADAKSILKEKRDQIESLIENKIHFNGIESLLPLFYKKPSPLFDYLPANTVIIDAGETNALLDTTSLFKEWSTIQENSEHIESIFEPSELFFTPEKIEAKLNTYAYASTDLNTGLNENHSLILGHTESNVELRNQIKAKVTSVHHLEPLAQWLNDKRQEGLTAILVCQNLSQKERFLDLLKRFELPLKSFEPLENENFFESLSKNQTDSNLIHLLQGDLHEGFLDLQNKHIWISDEEIFGKKAKRAYAHHHKAEAFSSFSELTEGDFLIHADHGIGIYRGLTLLDYDVYKNDFLSLEYLDGDKLYVPVDKLSKVQRYVAQEGTLPALDKLGSTRWAKTIGRAKKAAQKLAGELLKLQALRASLTGVAFEPCLEAMEEFALSFGFEETFDQARAILETLEDLQSVKPTDRLVCGDVGYGKTEVALRAAFLALQNHKQVAILVPTTVLAFQHFKTCKERFKNYPYNIELLSRFRTPQEQKTSIERLKDGRAQIVVGTHRLLSKDIEFSDLGLLIVDEEHRFGVIHKEKIKKMRNLVDILTLTATPIPRTLNFALNGIRDLSIINTPPVDRLAIKTYTTAFDPPTLRDAMLKELRRGGQIYFVHNRVQSIEKVTKRLATLMPEARIRFGHGQMPEDDLEDLMIAFMNHEFDILVSTTIIESGLDIPNANTLIIDRADHLGLSQLYQLRGRVGRSDKQAYCYLLVPEDDLLTTKAKRRLATILRFTELGSGFKVASHDLEIRGAGNILGDEQSGHIAAIGFDLYMNLLQEAILSLKEEAPPEDFECELKLNATAKIPDSYIPDKALRLILYKNLSSAKTDTEIEALAEDWMDRFGKMPIETHHLILMMRLKLLAQKLLLTSLKETAGVFLITPHKNHKMDLNALMALVKKKPHLYSFTPDGQLMIKAFKGETQTKLLDLLEFLKNHQN